MKPQALPGFRDFYPDQAELRRHIFDAWRTVAERYGFEEYDGPPLETLELFTQKSGAEIVDQLYHFEDKGGRAVALRPEMTPTLARMVSARAGGLKKPIRWFSLPQLFRYERQQRGRLREHFQLNVDIIGENSSLADAEIIAVAIDIMRSLGLKGSDVRVRMSDRRLIRALLSQAGVAEQQMVVALNAIDKIERDTPDRLMSTMSEAGIQPSVGERVLHIGGLRGLEDVQVAVGSLAEGREALTLLKECVESLDTMGLSEFVDIDLSIVRGLAYYTGIVFELFDAQRSLRAICGGGRYDNLLDGLGGVDLPAVGFGMGDVVLGELLQDRGWVARKRPRLDAFVVGVTAEDVSTVIALAAKLRQRGLRIEYALKTQSVTKQLNIASSRPARYAIIVGPDERATQSFLVKRLADGTESRMNEEEIANALMGDGGSSIRD